MNDRERSKLFNQVIRAQIKQRDGLIATSRARLLRILQAIQDEITVLLARQPSDFQQWHQGQIQSQIEVILSRLASSSSTAMNEQIDLIAQLGLMMLDKALEPAGVTLVGITPSLDVNLLGNLKNFHTGRIRDISRKAQGKVELELAQVALGTKSPYDAQQAIRAIMAAEPRTRIETIMNTALPSVFNTASQSRYDQASSVLPGLKKRWYHSHRGQARPTHRFAHLQTVDVDKPFQIGMVRMMHPHDPRAPAAEVIRCRCHHRPWMESWDVLEPARKV